MSLAQSKFSGGRWWAGFFIMSRYKRAQTKPITAAVEWLAQTSELEYVCNSTLPLVEERIIYASDEHSIKMITDHKGLLDSHQSFARRCKTIGGRNAKRKALTLIGAHRHRPKFYKPPWISIMAPIIIGPHSE